MNKKARREDCVGKLCEESVPDGTGCSRESAQREVFLVGLSVLAVLWNCDSSAQPPWGAMRPIIVKA